MTTKVIRFALMLSLSALLSLPPARRLVDLLPERFTGRLTPAASEQLANVRAIYVPFMQDPIAIHFEWPEIVLYGPNATPERLAHEAMHVIDPCRMDDACATAFANSLPPELLYSSWELYRHGAWRDREAWAMVPMLFDWHVDQMPAAVQSEYAAVFH